MCIIFHTINFKQQRRTVTEYAYTTLRTVADKQTDSSRWCRFIFVWRSRDRASLMYSFKYNQQDATLYNILYYCQCSTCFRRFLHPSSEAQKLYTQQRYMSSLLAATASVGELELTNASGSSKQALLIPDAVCTAFELLMMGGETAWNM